MTERTPLVSVVIIFLNPTAAYLNEAIASVKAQTLPDWEVLLVDDGSTDDSTAAARAAAAADPERIHYLQHPNHTNCGMSASRNRGIRAARGRYVTFLDADDIYLPERLSHHVAILERHPDVAMAYGPTLYWYSWRPGALERDFPGKLGVALDVPHAAPTILRGFLETSGGILPGICSVTVRREKILAVGCFEETFRGCYEDQVFLSKICASESVIVTDHLLDYYRQHDESCSALAMDSGDYSEYLPHAARERYLRWLDGYLAERSVTDAATLRALRHELWPYDHPTLYRTLIMPWVKLRLWLRLRRKQLARRLLGTAPASEASLRT
jgi:glycosyltransferase involved in cell wall biosynthesis